MSSLNLNVLIVWWRTWLAFVSTPGKWPLNPWNFLSTRRVSDIHNGPPGPHLIVYVDCDRDGALHLLCWWDDSVWELAMPQTPIRWLEELCARRYQLYLQEDRAAGNWVQLLGQWFNQSCPWNPNTKLRWAPLVDSTLQYTRSVSFLEHDRIFPSGTLTDLTLYFSAFVSLCYNSITVISIAFSCVLLVILVNDQTWGCSKNLWVCRQLVRSGSGLGTLPTCGWYLRWGQSCGGPCT